jgi:CubicO group peptidase (beta-lactamase class C family)
MKNLTLLILSAFLLSGSYAQQLSKNDEIYIDSLMNANYKPTEPGAVLLIAEDGKAVYRKAFGLASIELTVPNRPEFTFRIGSMTKQFTAVSILQLAEKGKLSLQDDIRTYLPQYNTHGRRITVENLLTHTSGITSYTEKGDFYKNIAIDQTKDQIAQYFMNDSLLFEPGTDWSYSNSGYVVAGLIVEKVTGMPLNEYFDKNIFEPLGMSYTTTGTSDHVIPLAVSGYEGAENGTFKPAGYLSWTWPYAAGDIVSNVDDLLKWDESFYTNRILDKDWITKAWTSFELKNGQKTNYGYGWSVNDYKGLQIISHGGAINGFLSDGIRIPSRHLYVVILSNKATIGPGKFSSLIAMRLVGKPIASPPGFKISQKKMKEFMGVYLVHRVGSRITSNAGSDKVYRYITLTNDSLFSQRTGASKTAMLNVGEDLFLFNESSNYAQFHRDGKGKVNSVEIFSIPTNYGPNESEPLTELPLPVEKVIVSIPESVTSKYKGKYDFGGGLFMDVITEGSRVYLQPGGQEKEEMFPESDTKFFFKSVDATVEFQVSANGTVTGMIFKQGATYEGKKTE